MLSIGFLFTPLLLAELPGEPLVSTVPELRESVRIAETVQGADGVLYLWGAFHTVNGHETGGLLKLGPNGDVADILAEPLVQPPGSGSIPLDTFFSPQRLSDGLWALNDGRLMLLRGGAAGAILDQDGELSQGFFAGFPPEIAHLEPQFEREGDLYFIVVKSDGTRHLSRQSISADRWEPTALPSNDWPFPPTSAVPASDGQIRVVGSDLTFSLLLPYSSEYRQRVFSIEANGILVTDEEIWDPGWDRRATLGLSWNGSGYRMMLGPKTWLWMFWPSPTVSDYRIEWRDTNSQLVRAMDFRVPHLTFGGGQFVFAEEPGGAVVATGENGGLQRWLADGTPDESFTSPGPARSILALPDGKWLLDGTRRILADGRDDPSWKRPNLERPARVTHFEKMPDGGWLTAGNFHRADGVLTNRIAKWQVDGNLDDTFKADPRISGIHSMVVVPDGSVLVATGFHRVTLEDGRSSDLVRLLPSGELDEAFFPPLPEESTEGLIVFPNMTTEHIAIQPDGAFLVLTSRQASDIRQYSFERRFPDGSPDTSFHGRSSYQWINPMDLFVLDDGSFFLRGALYDPSGELVLTVDGSEEAWGYRALCQMPDGAVIFSDSTGNRNRLRRWNDGEWDDGFAGAVYFATGATPAGDGKLLLWGNSLKGEVFPGTRLVRLHRNGRVDPTFRAPRLGRHLRRGAGPWQTLFPDGIQSIDPVEWAADGFVSSARWDESSDRVWIAGDFNMADGLPRDGLAVLHGESPSDYEAWSQAALRYHPDSRAPNQDVNGDGRMNLLAYATGGDPLVALASDSALRAIPGEPLAFALWLNPDAADVWSLIEVSSDLVNWAPGTESEVSILSTEDQLIFQLSAESERCFVRVRFGLAPP